MQKLKELVVKSRPIEASLTQRETTLRALNGQITAMNSQIQSLQDSKELAEQRKAELNHIAQVARGVAFSLNVKLAEVEDDLNNAQTELTRRERKIFQLEEEGTP